MILREKTFPIVMTIYRFLNQKPFDFYSSIFSISSSSLDTARGDGVSEEERRVISPR